MYEIYFFKFSKMFSLSPFVEAEVKVTAASIRVPDSPVYITCTAQTGGHVVAPSLSGCHIGGPVHFNIRVNSLDEGKSPTY